MTEINVSGITFRTFQQEKNANLQWLFQVQKTTILRKDYHIA